MHDPVPMNCRLDYAATRHVCCKCSVFCYVLQAEDIVVGDSNVIRAIFKSGVRNN